MKTEKKFFKKTIIIILFLTISVCIFFNIQNFIFAFWPDAKPDLKNFNREYKNYEIVINFLVNNKEINIGDSLSCDNYNRKLINVETKKTINFDKNVQKAFYNIYKKTLKNTNLSYIYIRNNYIDFNIGDFFVIRYTYNDIKPQKLNSSFDKYLNFKIKKLRDNWYTIQGIAKKGYENIINTHTLPGM